MKSIPILFCLLSLSAAAAERPNLVFILADDLGYGDLSCYNARSKIPTPRLDRLAGEGLRFTDAHAPDSVCTPSRYGILTGRYCFRSPLKAGVLESWGEPLIDAGRLTVPALLRQSGYATAAIGKWHLGWTWPTRDGRPPASRDGIGNVDFTRPIADGPTHRGFDTFFGVDLPNMPPYAFIANDRTVGLPSVPAPIEKGRINRPGPMVPGWDLSAIMPEITRHAVRYVEQAAAEPAHRPFFLYFALTSPHYPIVPVAEFKGRSQAGAYGDYVAQMDSSVGAVLDALDRTGQAASTLVFFCSDNGPEVIQSEADAYERIRAYGHSSMDGWRGAKRDTWEGGHRIPFLVRWPGRIRAGAVSAETVDEVDLMATCAALLGVRLPAGAGEDSCNLLPVLLGEKHDGPVRPAILLHSGKGQFGIRQGDWVLIDAPSGSGNAARGAEPDWFKQQRGYAADGLPGELYNLREDPAQRHNLYGDEPGRVKRLKALLERMKAAGSNDPARRRHAIPDE